MAKKNKFFAQAQIVHNIQKANVDTRNWVKMKSPFHLFPHMARTDPQPGKKKRK